jgi:hypothetical protein
VYVLSHLTSFVQDGIIMAPIGIARSDGIVSERRTTTRRSEETMRREAQGVARGQTAQEGERMRG